MRAQRTTPGTWTNAEENAEAELHRRGVMTIDGGYPHFKKSALVDGAQTPLREHWQDVLADFRQIHPEPETLVLTP